MVLSLLFELSSSAGDGLTEGLGESDGNTDGLTDGVGVGLSVGDGLTLGEGDGTGDGQFELLSTVTGIDPTYEVPLYQMVTYIFPVPVFNG